VRPPAGDATTPDPVDASGGATVAASPVAAGAATEAAA
jgi:hypothetical protein